MNSQINQNIEDYFKLLWQDYIAFNPHAGKIFRFFTERGEVVKNDHIALRTFLIDSFDLEMLARPFLELGFEWRSTYQFPKKKLFAKYLAHSEPGHPRVFISGLEVHKFSRELQGIIKSLLAEVTNAFKFQKNLPMSGRPWNLTFEDYKILRAESEYAAWLAAFGFRPNHFTVSVNHLKSFSSMEILTKELLKAGFQLNTSGSIIKGSKNVFLEQASTLAEPVPVQFKDGTFDIPACYYEFARRYPLQNGKIFDGFIADSADKIFESTDLK